MHFALSVTALLAMASSALAQGKDTTIQQDKDNGPTKEFNPISTPPANETLKAGEIYMVNFTVPELYRGQKVSLELLGGSSTGTLDALEKDGAGKPVPFATDEIDTSGPTGTFEWKVNPIKPGLAYYGLKMRLQSNPTVYQFSPGFHIEGGSTAAASTGKDTASTGKDTASTGKDTASNNAGSAADDSDPVQTVVLSSVSPTASATSLVAAVKATGAAGLVDCDKNATSSGKSSGASSGPSSSSGSSGPSGSSGSSGDLPSSPSNRLGSTATNSTGASKSGAPLQSSGAAPMVHTGLFAFTGALLAVMVL
ncbi:hypothetical protein CDD83_8669 [Cordyceps sp. RAO-2017]|nr:hypothetical protein CDD83_8669 [Cordyceps sp. RAO-2017]